MSDYKISEKDMVNIHKERNNISGTQWLRLIFCQLQEIKQLLKKGKKR